MKMSSSQTILSVHGKTKRTMLRWLIEIGALGICSVFFLIPFYFILINAFKTSREAAQFTLSWPGEFQIVENLMAVWTVRDNILLTAYYNSTVMTFFSIVILVFVCSMTGFVLQRRVGRGPTIIQFLVLAGLMVPPAIVPTIWVLDLLGLFKTMPGIVLVMVAINIPFTIILYTGFVATIPREIDEAAVIDGCGSWKLFFNIIFPLLKPIHSTVIILTAVIIFNDFVHPLYFFPGAENVTVQLTLYNFMSMYNTEWNLLFANVLLVTIPPLILFLIFNKRIVDGMTAGSIKG